MTAPPKAVPPGLAAGRPPSVDAVLRSAASEADIARYGRQAVVGAVRTVLAQVRSGGTTSAPAPDIETLAALASRLLAQAAIPSLRRVHNLTGTVLHTNLGRAVLAEEAIEAAVAAMRHAVTLEYDVATGGRGERDDHVRGLIREITGAEDAVIVNNNAAAVLLALNTFGSGREALVSRGELIEIGGSFRLPDIMRRAGARLVEVGTTNRTHRADFEGALGAETGLILKAHTSNYLIQGFTATVPPAALAEIARGHGVPFIDDLGSGTLVDLARYGLRPEPTVQQALAAGADLVTFSGDKLLGGPQAGIIAGRRDLVARIAKNPMKRALRLDKIRLAALEATFRLYRDPDRLPERLPTLRLLTRPREAISVLAERLRQPVQAALAEGYRVAVVDCASQIGSGALPLETLPSAGLALRPAPGPGEGRRLEALARALRTLSEPVIGRIADGALVLDLRTLEDEAALLATLEGLSLDPASG